MVPIPQSEIDMNPRNLESGDSAFPAALMAVPAVIGALVWIGAILTRIPLH